MGLAVNPHLTTFSSYNSSRNSNSAPAEIPKTDLITCVLIDGHALIQSPQSCSTFCDYTTVFVKSVLKHLDQQQHGLMLHSIAVWEISRSNRQHVPNEKRKQDQLESSFKPLMSQYHKYGISLLPWGTTKPILLHICPQSFYMQPNQCQKTEIIAGGGFPDPENAKSSKRGGCHLVGKP